MGLILLRYGEVAIKGGNRHLFISRLRRNIRDCLAANHLTGEVTSEGQRILVRTEQVEEALAPLSRVFGIVSLSPVVEVANARYDNRAVIEHMREQHSWERRARVYDALWRSNRVAA